MADLAQIQQQQEAQNAVITLAIAELVQHWTDAVTLSPPELTALLVDAIPDIITRYGAMAASLAADFYEELRDQAGVPGLFFADPADVAELARLEKVARWGVSPMWAPQEYQDPEKALNKLAGGIQRQITAPARDTIVGAAAGDPATARWTRVAREDACAFCALLATRPAGDYHSKESALTVINTASSKGRHNEGRPLGEKYHDDCRCIAMPFWSDADYVEPDYVGRWRQIYQDSTTKPEFALKDSDGKPKDGLAHFRAALTASRTPADANPTTSGPEPE